MPGSPPRSMRLPLTTPPPSTLSSSVSPVDQRISRSAAFISPISFMPEEMSLTAAEEGLAAERVTCVTGSDSSRVFHSPQSGQRPFHFGDS